MHFVRYLLRRVLVVLVVIFAVAEITAPLWMAIACVAALAFGLLSLGRLEICIRREREQPAAG
jgi:hypothetical protein